MDIKTLAESQRARLAGERERNRAEFPFAGQDQDVLKAAGIPSRVVYA
ncbi:MAG: hypothetical protein KGL35_00925 [Bradyrhizobium sp.]|nr:hypothetical protein [Bradyrhizobium sp.]